MIDQLANAGADAIPVVESAEQSANEQATPAEQTDLKKEPGETAAEYTAREKKLLNAMSHKDRRIGKLTARQYEAEAKLKQLEEQLAKNQPNNPSSTPEQAKFDNYEDYLKALASHQVNEKFQESDRKRQHEQSQLSERQWVEERSAHVEENDAAAKQSFSDYDKVFQDNEDVIRDMPPHVQRAFLEAENPAYAFYSLAIDGKLEDLSRMSPYQVAAMVARHEDKALALSKQKQVTKAPAPISPSKGNAPGSKSLDSMSGDELLKWVRSK